MPNVFYHVILVCEISICVTWRRLCHAGTHLLGPPSQQLKGLRIEVFMSYTHTVKAGVICIGLNVAAERFTPDMTNRFTRQPLNWPKSLGNLGVEWLHLETQGGMMSLIIAHCQVQAIIKMSGVAQTYQMCISPHRRAFMLSFCFKRIVCIMFHSVTVIRSNYLFFCNLLCFF